MNKTFMDLLSESTIFQGIITIMVLGTWCYMLVTGQNTPEILNVTMGTVVGFFFGGKYVQAMQNARSKPK